MGKSLALATGWMWLSWGRSSTSPQASVVFKALERLPGARRLSEANRVSGSSVALVSQS